MRVGKADPHKSQALAKTRLEARLQITTVI